MSLERRRTAESPRFACCVGPTALVLVLLLASSSSSPAFADGNSANGANGGEPGRQGSRGRSTEQDGPLPLWVLLPGQEGVATVMLGGTEGVAGCAFTSARVERERIVATFACANGHAPFTVAMSHPGAWGCSGECTEKFVIVVTRGSAPSGFLAALGRRVAANEARIRWTTPGGRSRVAVWFLHYVPRPGPAFGVLAVVAMVLLLVFDRPRGAKAP